MTSTSERGDVVLGWLVRVVLVLAVLSLLAFDSVALVIAHVAVHDDATEAVNAASESWKARPDLQLAYNAAVKSAEGHGDSVESGTFSADPDGTVHLRIHRKATTLLIYRISPLAGYADVSATASGRAFGS
ncbi:MAG: hypothetical protein M3Z02_06730 [Actinomycetota bacterium]|nr:hypothetical protein [Actinomycetota bacterium]